MCVCVCVCVLCVFRSVEKKKETEKLSTNASPACGMTQSFFIIITDFSLSLSVFSLSALLLASDVHQVHKG